MRRLVAINMLLCLGCVCVVGAPGCSEGGAKPDGGAGDASTDTLPPGDGGDPGPLGFVVTVSGEDLSVNGYPWTKGQPSQGDPPQLVDGWALRFDRILVTVGKIRLNADPDKDPNDRTVLGPLVAEDPGPYAVDVVKGGTIVGKSGSPDEKTVAITSFVGDGKLDPTQRYAFSYSLLPASGTAKNVNLDAAAQALYEEAKAKGWAMVFQGTATFSGDAPPMATPFAKMPREVNFTLGLANPSTYVNCSNTDLMQVGGEFPRGVQPNATRSTIVQITLHTDHLFWDELNVEGTPLHFDPFAAVASTYGTGQPSGEVTSDALASLDVTGFRTKDGESLPWRSLVPDYAAPAGQMNYKTNGTTLVPAGSFLSYLAHSAAAGGHMNADGECFVKKDF